jgi:hypothetical protein
LNLTTRRARILSCAALAGPLLLLCAPFLFTARTLGGQDFQPGYGPLYDFARESWRRDGELPRWNPRHFAGVPFAGNPQAGLFYPPNALFLVAPSSLAFEWLTFLHLLAAAGGMYRLIRGFRMRRDAAVLAGLSFALSQSILGRVTAGHYPYFVTLCLAPLLLHQVRLLLDRPRPLHAAGLAAVVAAILLGGSTQFILHLALLAGALAVWRLELRRRQRQPVLPAAGLAFAALAAAVAISAVHLVPGVSLAAESSRAAKGNEAMIAPYGDFDATALVGFLLPGFPWRTSANLWLWHEKALYAGLLPLLLAAVAVFKDRSGLTKFFAAALGVSLLAAAGPSLPIHHLLSVLPYYDRFRIPERIVWVAVLSVSVLAARGWTVWRDCADRRKAIVTAAGVAAIAALAIGLAWRAPREAALFGLTAAGAIAAFASPPRWAIGIAGIVLSADLGGHALAKLNFLPPGDPLPPPWYERMIGVERDQFRLLDLTDTRVGASVRGFRLLRCGGYPVPSRLSEYYARAWQDPLADMDSLPTATTLKDVSILRSLNVRWIVTAGSPHPEWRKISPGPGASLYEDPGALPFASASDGGAVDWSRPTMNRLDVTADLERPGRIVLREMLSPGWRAWRDGQEIPIQPEQGLMMSLDAPAGRSTVTMSYAPPGRTATFVLLGLGLASIAVLLALGLQRRT